MGLVTHTNATSGQVLTAAFYNNSFNAIINQVNGNLDANNIKDSAVSAAKIATGAVQTAKIQDGAVTGAKIAMGSDAHGDILFRGASAYERLAAGTAGQALKSAGSGADAYWGNVSEVSVLTGTISNGGTIPLPSGFTEGQCEWAVMAYDFTFNADQHATAFQHKAQANGTRTVTTATTGSTATSTAWYIIIGVK